MCPSSPSTTIINAFLRGLYHLYARAHLALGLTIGDCWKAVSTDGDAFPPPSGNLPCRCRAEGSAFPPLVAYHRMLSIPRSYCRRFTGFELPKVYRLRGLVWKMFVWARGNDIKDHYARSTRRYSQNTLYPSRSTV